MARLDSFLRLVVEQHASDLHLPAGSTPIIRLNGDLVPLPLRTLSDLEARAIIVIGTIGISVMAWGGRMVLSRLDEQDHTMIEIRELLRETERQMGEVVHNLDIRLTRIETQCQVTLAKFPNHETRE